MVKALRQQLNFSRRIRLTDNPRTLWLAILPVLLIIAPVLPGLYWALSPAWEAQVWQQLWLDPQLPQALESTLISSLLGSFLAALSAATLAMLIYPSALWIRLQRHLALLLSVPHAAFAVGMFFLLSPSGWLARAIAPVLGWVSPPTWISVQDPFGLSLALALAIKESWFLLWVLMALLGEQAVSRQMLVARSLGYGRLQIWRAVLWPQLLPRLAWPMAAVLAYGLSVVDMSLVLGPGTPPTLAVLVWQWLIDANPDKQALGAAASLLLLVLLLAVGGFARLAWLVYRRQKKQHLPTGKRQPRAAPAWLKLHIPLLGIGYLVVALLLLWSLAGPWFFPDFWPQSLTLRSWQGLNWQPFWTTLWLATASSVLCVATTLVWLEWGPKRFNGIIYLPLIVPVLPLVAGQYAALLRLRLDGQALGVLWSHLLMVLPYTLLTLVGAYRAFDARLMTCARALGHSRLSACLQLKWPLLQRPIAACLAIGFAISVAQYLPTLFAGGGRFATVTTEAVALSAGGNRRVLAVQALLQVVLPLAAFALAALWPRFNSRNRLGLR
ncbi:Inner membrane ABC transporter permease protein YnjC [Polaromonas vacuolata]|uniref:Inner membrane ABC transporter permease protein YnjC n=1 Tax=Polaromonas vacuolata TaxID=37448 RepID=A0A6H2H6T3_9BURK|nr:Inner membrane ABC transporter permease protein YnjC [Polaromonas vacuolata]